MKSLTDRFPVHLSQNSLDISSSSFPIRIIVAYPESNRLSATDFQKDINKIRQAGIGYMSVDEISKKGNLHYKGISSLLSIPSINLTLLKPSLRPLVRDAYDTYMNGDPKHGVQELGQLMEKYMKDLAKQAIAAGKLIRTGYVPERFYNLTTLIDELLAERILDLGTLGNCRSFVYPRNDTSHPPRSIQAAKKIEIKYKENFQKGVSILEELPKRFQDKGYKFRV